MAAPALSPRTPACNWISPADRPHHRGFQGHRPGLRPGVGGGGLPPAFGRAQRPGDGASPRRVGGCLRRAGGGCTRWTCPPHAAMEQLAERAKDSDILVNNAGDIPAGRPDGGERRRLARRIRPEAVRLHHALPPVLPSHGGRRGGVIVNIIGNSRRELGCRLLRRVHRQRGVDGVHPRHRRRQPGRRGARGWASTQAPSPPTAWSS